MNKILITNCIPTDLSTTVKPTPIYKDWVALNFVHDETVDVSIEYIQEEPAITGSTGMVGGLKIPLAFRRSAYLTDTMTPEQYRLWRCSDFNPLSLLLILIVENDGADDYYAVCYPTSETSTDFLLGVVIKGCCGCGAPTEALRPISKVMTGFRKHPEYQVDYDIYADRAHLVIGYVIDARGGLITHGSSIGGSWLTAKGAFWSLAALLTIQMLIEEGELT